MCVSVIVKFITCQGSFMRILWDMNSKCFLKYIFLFVYAHISIYNHKKPQQNERKTKWTKNLVSFWCKVSVPKTWMYFVFGSRWLQSKKWGSVSWALHLFHHGIYCGISCAHDDHLLKDFDSIIKILMQWDSKDKHCWKMHKTVQLFWHMSCYLNCSLHYKAQPDESPGHLQGPGRCSGCGTCWDFSRVVQRNCFPWAVFWAILGCSITGQTAQVNKLRCKFCYKPHPNAWLLS